ncbi:MAG: GntR family transcriptional regulator, partial [Rhodobacteraceae bacterium]|nr:GntR family transcriptional regulator [Paracoccaceae bacterium]
MADTIWQPDLSRFDGPKYLALTRALREAVRTGGLEKGARLPPVRDLAWRLGMTPGTVARAYQIMTQEGLLEAAVGRGTFVAATHPKFGASQALILEAPASSRDDAAEGSGPADLRSPKLPEVGQNEAISAIYRRLAEQGG